MVLSCVLYNGYPQVRFEGWLWRLGLSQGQLLCLVACPFLFNNRSNNFVLPNSVSFSEIARLRWPTESHAGLLNFGRLILKAWGLARFRLLFLH